ncbi:MAG: o-succinylbenzoate synthase [Anaerolineales bacterium]|nr:o-succinylbenzoate synthase [Anaerolineales bacterium]MCX7754435.1 o-succinylbenzoate synthase [Anaerolineales bacterium]MDW8276549.1 o-succinylbenzoate synthase [Anaerolineales bacterium]
MKLERITLYPLKMPLVSHFETSFGRIYERECVLVKVESEGLTGWGECAADRDPGYSYETTGTVMHILKDFVLPLLAGQQVADAADFQRRVAPIRGHHLAKAGVEMAIWDLLGQRQGKSLRELFGGQRERVEVGVSVGIQDTTADLLRTVERYVSEGYRRVKLKIKPGRDVSETQAVRRAYPSLKLQVDANSAYSLQTAEALHPLDDLDLLLIEQPLYEDDLWDHRLLQKKLRTPLCLDESVISPRHARYAIEMEACRVINIKPGRVGGLSQALEIHRMCHEINMPVWCGGMLETNIGRASNLALASLPGFTLPGDISASARYYRQDVTDETFTLNPDSTITVPNAPGLGVTVNETRVKEFALGKVVMPDS